MKKLVTIILLGLTAIGYAALTPQLVRAAKAPVALGFIAFDATQSPIIKQDLVNSGRFRLVVAPKVRAVDDAAELDVKAWQKKGVRYVLFGNGRQADLVDLSAAPVPTRLLQSNSSAPHQVANAVFKQLLGQPGYFNDKLAYVLLQRQAGLPTQYSLMTADIDGQNEKTITTSNLPIMSPAWSHDGKQLTYVSFAKGAGTIYIANIAGGDQQQVVTSTGLNAAPAFSPDDKNLAFMSTRNGQSNLYQINLVTKKVTQLTNGWIIDAGPVYSADGSSLYFTSTRGGTPQIYQLTLATKQITRVTFNGDYNAKASVSSNTLVFLHRRWGLFGVASQALAGGKLTVLDRNIGDNAPSLVPQGNMVVFSQRYAGRNILAMVSTDGQIKLRLPAENGSVEMPAATR